MPSIFSLETELLLMFINKQTEIKNLTNNIDNDFLLKQKEELDIFKNKLDEYKIILESNKKEICKQDQWFEINCKK
jgi:hypothetical protein